MTTEGFTYAFVVLALLPADFLCFICILEINVIMLRIIIKLLKYLKHFYIPFKIWLDVI
jgi:hypothetical protein